MKSNNTKIIPQWRSVATVALFLFLTPMRYADQASASGGELSEGWKYTIAILALVLFLGLAIFIQLRAEREK